MFIYESAREVKVFPSTFYILMKGDFILIATQEKEFFERMKNSAKVVRKVQIMFGTLDRADVCDIYSIILYGHTVDEQTTSQHDAVVDVSSN